MNNHPVTLISYKSVKTERGTTLWFVTYDNRILGDSRPFDTPEEASDAAEEAVERAGFDSDNYRRAVYRPGY